MSVPSLNLLIISFYFPPFMRVGARRWAKHAKYLRRLGVDFHILSARFDGRSPWDKDIVSFSDRISRVEANHSALPYHMRNLPANILQKIRWKLSLWWWPLRLKKQKNNFNDVSVGNEEAFYKAARRLIADNGHNLVVLSAGPFSYSQILPRLKKEFPQVRLVMDYRDYWEDEFPGLTTAQITHEKEKQANVLKAVDLVLSPNEEMRHYYADTFGKSSYSLPHCFDEEDLQFAVPVESRTQVLSLLYGGAFYAGIDESLNLFRDFMDVLSGMRPVEADFYVSVRGYEEELRHPSIRRHEFTDLVSYFGKVAACDYVILILPPNRVNAMSSKFFELVAMRKPILYFGGEGAVSEYLTNNRLGFHICKGNLQEQATAVISNLQNQSVPDHNYDTSGHSFLLQTQKLLEELKTI